MPVHLKRLTLRNFKSFRSATIPFAPGFTAIMGPNGSGKSNIIDALLFVLGEGKLKHIRASRLKDLVFHGARDGVAVVSLDLTDGERDYSISRMIDRKGRSVYRLNGKRVMRHEVISLLSSLGISPEGYNIVLQGEITRLFNMNPVERRQIIDQVAGVAEYEEKKSEALKELERVDAEIQDAELILGERRSILKRLEEERNAALEYMELKKELSALRKALLRKRLEDAEAKIRELEERKDQLSSRKSALEAEKEKLSARLDEISAEIARVDEEIRALIGASASALENARIRYSNLTRELEERKSERERTIERLSDIALRKERLEKELDALEADLRDVRLRLKEKEKEHASLSSQLSELVGRLRVAEEERGASKERIVEIDEELSRLREEFANVKAEHGRLVGEYNARLEEAKKAEEKRRRAEEARKKAEERLKELEEEKRKLEREKRELIEREKRLNTEYLALSEEIKKLRERLGAYRGASAALRSLGVGVDVLDALLRAQREGKLFGIHGFVAQLIRYDDKYAAAIEAAGGRRLFYIVVDTADAAAEAIKYLKRNGLGRATFAPLDRVRGHLTDVPPGDGILGRLIDFVRFEERYRPVMEYVFGDTLLVRDIDVAKHLAGKYRAVTLSGDIVERSGVMSGGARQSTRILDLFRAAEAKRELDEKEREAKEILSELYRVRDRMQAITSRLSRIGGDMEAIRARLKEVEEEAPSDLADLERRIAEAERRMQEIAQRISDLELERARLMEALRKTDVKELEEMERLKSLVESLSAEISEMRTQVAKLEERRRAMKREIEELSQEEIRLRERKEELDAEIERLEREVEAAKKRLLEMETEYAEQKRKLSDLQARREALENERAETLQRMQEISGEISSIERELAVLEEKVRALRLDVEDLRRELADYEGVPDVSLPPNPQERMDEILSRMRELEPVNMRAIDEYEEMKKKIDEIEAKIEKLREERRAVLELMEEIERKKVRAFMETFHAVSKLFSNIFSELTGGKASLRLTDEENVFQSGLIIEAQPKGKPLKNLDAMSGGEKALVALAFIFAIAMYRPIGFYVLDEPDLMLDKPNAEKMARFIKRLSKDNQFIVVSHRDVVLKEADQIIGVYMREDGSSAIEILLSSEAGGSGQQAS